LKWLVEWGEAESRSTQVPESSIAKFQIGLMDDRKIDSRIGRIWLIVIVFSISAWAGPSRLRNTVWKNVTAVEIERAAQGDLAVTGKQVLQVAAKSGSLYLISKAALISGNAGAERLLQAAILGGERIELATASLAVVWCLQGQAERAARLFPAESAQTMARFYARRAAAAHAKSEEAHGLVEMALLLDRNCAEAHAMLGRECIEREEWKCAAARYQKAAESDRSAAASSDYLVQAGNAWQLAGISREAINTYRKATERSSENWRAWENLANSLISAREYKMAEAELQAIIRQNPSWVGFYISLGNLMMLQHKLTAAADFYRQAKELDPHSYAPYYGMGQLALANGDLNVARDFLEQASALAPRHNGVWVELARVLFKLGQTRAAVDAYHRAIDLVGDSQAFSGYRLELARMMDATGMKEEARKEWLAILRIDPENHAARVALSVASGK
jgi:tetratricopeptide (TPR) repeat protein